MNKIEIIEIFYLAPQARTMKINTAEMFEYTKIVNN